MVYTPELACDPMMCSLSPKLTFMDQMKSTTTKCTYEHINAFDHGMFHYCILDIR
jgi:hypothetical protein